MKLEMSALWVSALIFPAVIACSRGEGPAQSAAGGAHASLASYQGDPQGGGSSGGSVNETPPKDTGSETTGSAAQGSQKSAGEALKTPAMAQLKGIEGAAVAGTAHFYPQKNAVSVVIDVKHAVPGTYSVFLQPTECSMLKAQGTTGAAGAGAGAGAGGSEKGDKDKGAAIQPEPGTTGAGGANPTAGGGAEPMKQLTIGQLTVGKDGHGHLKTSISNADIQQQGSLLGQAVLIGTGEPSAKPSACGMVTETNTKQQKSEKSEKPESKT
jgi:hypothetical protein